MSQIEQATNNDSKVMSHNYLELGWPLKIILKQYNCEYLKRRVPLTTYHLVDKGPSWAQTWATSTKTSLTWNYLAGRFWPIEHSLPLPNLNKCLALSGPLAHFHCMCLHFPAWAPFFSVNFCSITKISNPKLHEGYKTDTLFLWLFLIVHFSRSKIRAKKSLSTDK